MTVLVLVLLGGLLAMDGVSAGQFMVSRPLVGGLIAGALVGDPVLGAAVGAVLEIYLLVSVPSGGGRFPEPGPATVVGAAAAAAVGGAEGLALGVAGGLVLGQVSSMTQTWLRHANARLVPVPGEGPLTAAEVRRAHVLALALDGLRGALFTAVGLALASLLTPRLAPGWPLGEPATRALVLLGAMVSLGILGRGDGLVPRRLAIFAAGLGGGLLAGSLMG
jgi:mannose/fructose/N-acetylgalactosamine-specific phosphotransferase system component IIC